MHHEPGPTFFQTWLSLIIRHFQCCQTFRELILLSCFAFRFKTTGTHVSHFFKVVRQFIFWRCHSSTRAMFLHILHYSSGFEHFCFNDIWSALGRQWRSHFKHPDLIPVADWHKAKMVRDVWVRAGEIREWTELAGALHYKELRLTLCGRTLMRTFMISRFMKMAWRTSRCIHEFCPVPRRDMERWMDGRQWLWQSSILVINNIQGLE